MRESLECQSTGVIDVELIVSMILASKRNTLGITARCFPSTKPRAANLVLGILSMNLAEERNTDERIETLVGLILSRNVARRSNARKINETTPR